MLSNQLLCVATRVKNMIQPIKLNDLLGIEDLENCKIRFLTKLSKEINPLDMFRNNDITELMNWLFWNYSKHKSFKVGQTVIGLVRIEGNKWLLFNLSMITEDLNIFNDVGFEYQTLKKYEKFFGRVIVEYNNRSQNLVRLASTVIHECNVAQILEQEFENDEFPGYDEVNLSWVSLSRIIKKGVWKTALENQKGVYLITDTNNGKTYVGSAYGDNMIYGRWLQYTKNGHGGNVNLKLLGFEYIKNYFRYSILEIYKSTTNDNLIINRESWWKEILQSRTYGYNKN